MNAKEIQDMAYKAKFWTADTSFGGVCWMGYHAELQRFAELIAAHERKELERELLKLKQGVASTSDYIQGRWDLIGEFQDVILARGKHDQR